MSDFIGPTHTSVRSKNPIGKTFDSIVRTSLSAHVLLVSLGEFLKETFDSFVRTLSAHVLNGIPGGIPNSLEIFLPYLI